LTFTDINSENAKTLHDDAKSAKNEKRKTYKTFVSKYILYIFNITIYYDIKVFNLQVRVNLLNPASLESA
jgi:hypothetical protein